MGRPKKTGLDYFSLDVKFVDDDDCIDLLEAEHGLTGFAILIKLWQKIYSNGYFISWNDDSVMLFAKNTSTEISVINSVVNTALLRNIFNKEMFEKYGILTSRGIQKRYVTACSAAKRKKIIIKKEHLLIENPDVLELIPEETELIPEETEFTPEFSTQSKVKESKVKQSKANKTKAKERQRDACAREEQPANLYRPDLGKLGATWIECKHGMYSTAVMGMFLEYLEKGLSVDVVVYAIQQASGKTVKNVKRYVEAILADKLARGILTRKQLDEDLKKQAANFSLLKGEKEQSGYGDTRTKDYA